MNTKRAVRAAFSRGAKATKKAFAQGEPKKKQTKREILLNIHKNLDKMIEQQKRLLGSS